MNWKTVATFLKSLPPVAYLVVAVLTFAASWLVMNNARQRAIGAERVLREQADSIAKVAIAQSDSAIKVAERVVRDAAAVRAAARAQAERDARARATADAAARASAGERDAARQLLADSMATVGQLRGEVGRLVAAGTADSVAHALERRSADSTKAFFERALRADTAAIVSVQEALAKAIDRAEKAEARAGHPKPARVGLLSRCGAMAGYGGTLQAGVVRAGPTIALGCRLFP